jgi:transposase
LLPLTAWRPVPTLRRGDIVVLDDLPAHKITAIREAIETVGAQFFLLPRFSPDMNLIEMACAKLKTLLRKSQARTVGALWRLIRTLLNEFQPNECTTISEQRAMESYSEIFSVNRPEVQSKLFQLKCH